MSLPESNRFEDIIIIWLDETITDPEKILSSQRQILLLSYIKSIQLFTTYSKCRHYIDKNKSIRIFFIISGSLGEKLIPIIHDLSQIIFIYIFCTHISKHEIWTGQYHKIRGVFNDDALLSIKIKNDVYSLSNVIFPFGLFDPAQQTLRDLTQDQASFICYQLLTDILLRLPQTLQAKADMIAECRVHYKENEAQLNKITLFEKNYKASDAIKCYTDNGFVFQLFNKAFRKQDFAIIFKYRYYLVDLFNQLTSLYNQQYQDRTGSLIVYRGQLMCKDELMKLKQNIGHLISVNTFLSTSKSCSVAANFSGNGEQESMGIVSVIFEITVDLEVSCRPFANIDQFSSIQDECEILFSIGTVFRIESVELETAMIWFVHLVWTKDCHEKFQEMKQLTSLLNFYNGQNIGEHPSILTFGLFLSKMGLLHQAMRFYISMRQLLPTDHPDRGVLHNNLVEVLRKLNYYNQARYHFELALEYSADTHSIFSPFWIILHSNIALLEVTCNRPEQALKCYRCALFMMHRWDGENDWEIVLRQETLAIVYHGMSIAYYLLKQFQKALELHQKAFQIELHLLPCDHPALIDSYNQLGKINIELGKWPKALENFKESLRIAQLNLLVKDWRLITLHITIALLVYSIDGNISQALTHCSCVHQLMDQSIFPAISRNRLEIYRTLACIYTHIGLGHIALEMWENFIKASKYQFIAESDTVDFSDLLEKMNISELPKQNHDQNLQYMILDGNKCLLKPCLSHFEAITRCSIADQWRAMGYIKQAICYYTWLLERLQTANDVEFVKVHQSRLHNNIAACYQDLDNDQEALYHYRRSLDILSPDDEQKSMHAAIIHYNIALINTNDNEFDEARIQLNKSLLHFSGLTEKQNSTLDVQIYIAFAKTYEQCSDWQKACDYYQRAIDKVKQDGPDHCVIKNYEKRLQHARGKQPTPDL